MSVLTLTYSSTVNLVVLPQLAKSLVDWARDTNSITLQLAGGRHGNVTTPRATGDTVDHHDPILQVMVSFSSESEQRSFSKRYKILLLDLSKYWS